MDSSQENGTTPSSPSLREITNSDETSTQDLVKLPTTKLEMETKLNDEIFYDTLSTVPRIDNRLSQSSAASDYEECTPQIMPEPCSETSIQFLQGNSQSSENIIRIENAVRFIYFFLQIYKMKKMEWP